MTADSIENIIIIPQVAASDTSGILIPLDTDLDSALARPTRPPGPMISTDTVATQPEPELWTTGMEGTARTVGVGDNSGVLAMISAIFLLMLLSYKQCRRIFSSMGRELWSTRPRENAFDEHTANESRVVVLMGLQWCVYTALLLYSHINSAHALDPHLAFRDTAVLTALMCGWYLAQLCAFNLLGYTFSTPEGQRRYVQGYTASQSLMGFTLIIPALVSIFYPAATPATTIAGICLYTIFRLIFIFKGFRIFYDKISSLLYFILYLCTLEIIPVIFIYNLALYCLTGNPTGA